MIFLLSIFELKINNVASQKISNENKKSKPKIEAIITATFVLGPHGKPPHEDTVPLIVRSSLECHIRTNG